MLPRLELFFEGAIARRAAWLWLLLPCAWLHGLVLWLRHRAYDSGLFKTKIAPLPVISVGNIVAGGTGKTPVTLWLAQEFSKQISVCILTRGHRSQIRKSTLVTTQPAVVVGDEPFILAKRSGAKVIVGPKRYDSAVLASDLGAKLAILDDGLQHRALARDSDVIVIDAKNPFGYGQLLPCGYLRDLRCRLGQASLFVATGVQTPQQYAAICAQLAPYSKASVLGAVLRVTAIRTLDGHSIPSLQGRPVAAFSGIANPGRFFASLVALGASINDTLVLPDHIAPSSLQLADLRTKAPLLVCTEKDAVKLSPCADIAYLEMALQITQQPGSFDLSILLPKR